ncbi:hypothetical protein HMPREF9374_3553 [Desmospora sp. 8437]|nr:hypothetical protein HMPREF9374_3553 [Desmospora sp. 8437]
MLPQALPFLSSLTFGKTGAKSFISQKKPDLLPRLSRCAAGILNAGGELMKRWLYPLVALILFTSACNNPSARPERPNDSYDESLYENRDKNALDYVTDRGRRPQHDRYNQIGFSRQTGNELYNATDGGAVPGPDVYINRSALARQISFLASKLPQVDDAIVVVTDDKVLIGVNADQGKISDKTLYEVRRTAWSLTPRYYQVYVTRDAAIRNKLNRIGQHAGGTQEKMRMSREEMEDLVSRMDRGEPMKKPLPMNPSPGKITRP